MGRTKNFENTFIVCSLLEPMFPDSKSRVFKWRLERLLLGVRASSIIYRHVKYKSYLHT